MWYCRISVFLPQCSNRMVICTGFSNYTTAENPPEASEPNEWQKLDRIVRATIWMHLSESVYFTLQSCSTTFELWKTMSDTYEKKFATTKINLTRRLYNLRMKESDSIKTHLNDYGSLSSQILAQGTKSNGAHE